VSRLRRLRALENRIGYRFGDSDLLVRALTHASIESSVCEDNDTLEFLGDRVLGLAIADMLTHMNPRASVGELATRFNYLVRKETCAEVALEVGLGQALLLGQSEMRSGGRRRTAILADAMEAVVAAVYRDSDFKAVRSLVVRLWGDRIKDSALMSKDAKTTLQEWAQASGMTLPEYSVSAISGPDHRPTFTVVVSLEDGRTAKRKASTKRQAEQAAALALLRHVQDPGE